LKTRLLQGAEEIQLKKPIKSKFGGGIKEFIFDEQEFYERIESPAKFLTTQEKQSIISELLNQITCNTDTEKLVLNEKPVKNGRKLLHWCLRNKVLQQTLPIHDPEDLKSLRKHWVFSLVRRQPLDHICSYFGVKLAMYFAWLGFYTRSLVIPALLGLAVWSTSGADATWDAAMFLVLSGFNLVWGLGFTDLWRQRCAEFAYKWGTLDMEEDLLQEPRPMFKGKRPWPE